MVTRSFILVLVAVVAASSLLFFGRLGFATLENWDEGIHAEVARTMYQDGHWLSMSYRDELYTAKPPLRFWLTAALFPIFGVTEFSLRFWSALAGVATALLITLWAWQWTHRLLATTVATATFLFSQLVFLHAFRTGETDGLLVLAFTAALYAYWRSQRERRWFLWFGVFVGVAIMFKWAVGLLPVVIIAIDLTIARRWRSLGLGTVLKAAGIALIIAAPWHAYETFRHGTAFWQSYLGFHVLDRVRESLYANDVPWWWYADILFRKTFPYKFLLPIAVAVSASRLVRKRDPLDRLFLLSSVIVFGIFSAAQTKFAWYILPALPTLALLMGRTVQEFVEEHRRWLDALFVAAAIATVYILPTGVDRGRTLWKLVPQAYLPLWFSTTTLGRLAVALAAGLLLLGLIAWLRRVLLQPRLVFAGVILTVLFGAAVAWQVAHIRFLPDTSPLERMARLAEERSVTTLDVVAVDLLRQPAGYFYLHRAGVTLREVGPDDVTAPDVLLKKDAVAPGDLGGGYRTILEDGPYLLLHSD